MPQTRITTLSPYRVKTRSPNQPCRGQDAFVVLAEALVFDIRKSRRDNTNAQQLKNRSFVFQNWCGLIPTTFPESKLTVFFTESTDLETEAEGRKRTDAINENMLPPFICVSCTLQIETQNPRCRNKAKDNSSCPRKLLQVQWRRSHPPPPTSRPAFSPFAIASPADACNLPSSAAASCSCPRSCARKSCARSSSCRRRRGSSRGNRQA